MSFQIKTFLSLSSTFLIFPISWRHFSLPIFEVQQNTSDPDPLVCWSGSVSLLNCWSGSASQLFCCSDLDPLVCCSTDPDLLDCSSADPDPLVGCSADPDPLFCCSADPDPLVCWLGPPVAPDKSWQAYLCKCRLPIKIPQVYHW